MYNTSVYEIVVTSCDKYIWAMKPFSYLFNKYFTTTKNVHVLCENSPNIRDYPPNFLFHPIGLWDKEYWSDGLFNFINGFQNPNILLLLDDYWLERDVDVSGIDVLSEYMVNNHDILRIDMTSDRLYSMGDSRSVKDVFHIKHYDIIESSAEQYNMSLQSGLFNIELLSRILIPNKSPWQIELESQPIIDLYNMKIYGTRQVPIRYINALGTGLPPNKVRLIGLNPYDIGVIQRSNWIPKEYDIVYEKI